MADETRETKEAPKVQSGEKAAAGGAPAAAPRRARRARRSVPEGVAHVHATFNNTIVTITDQQGLVVAWSSAGSVGFKGSRKGTPVAAQVAAVGCACKAADVGMRSVVGQVKGS